MLLDTRDTVSNELLSSEGLCSLIELEYHPSIYASLRKVEDYLISNAYGKELSIPISELIHLVFMKLSDELQHFFLKESGIIFPAICKNEKAKKAKEPGHHQLQKSLLETKTYQWIHIEGSLLYPKLITK